MKSYIAFTKKEFLEFTRTYKLLITAAVFLLIGIMSPAFAKIMPDLMKSMVTDKTITIHMGTPTALDSWTQFFKNISQIGLFVLVIIFSGIMSGEYRKGTLINMLTKGLSRPTVILSKFTMSASVWTLSYTLCFAVAYYYTKYFWSSDNLKNLLFSVFCMWVFGMLLVAALLLGAVIFKSTYGSLLSTGSFVIIMFTLGTLPKTKKYDPAKLASDNLSLLTGNSNPGDFTIPLLISLGLIVAFVLIAIVHFNKKQL